MFLEDRPVARWQQDEATGALLITSSVVLARFEFLDQRDASNPTVTIMATETSRQRCTLATRTQSPRPSRQFSMRGGE